jgi:hypothetical protein
MVPGLWAPLLAQPSNYTVTSVSSNFVMPAGYSTVETSGSIIVPIPGEVFFSANQSIRLEPGFHAKAGSVFNAEIIPYAGYSNNAVRPRGSFDGLSSSTVLQQQILSGSGWAADPILGAPVMQVVIFIDGEPACVAKTGGYRPDVEQFNINGGNSISSQDVTYSGWSFDYNVGNIGLGPHTVTALIYDYDAVDNEFNVGPKQFTVLPNIQSISSANATMAVGQPFTPAYNGGAGTGAWQFMIVGQTTWASAFWTPLAAGSYTFFIQKLGDTQTGPSNVAGPYTLTVGGQPPPAVSPDTTPPTVPANVVSIGHTYLTITLAWNVSTDNVGVTGYQIYRNGVEAGTSTGLTYTDYALSPGTSYTYMVKAADAAGNLSAASNSVTAATLTGNPNGAYPGASNLTNEQAAALGLVPSHGVSTDTTNQLQFKVLKPGN